MDRSAADELVPLPHDALAEEAVLGSILKDPSCLPVVRDALEPTDFYVDRYRHIYAAILAAPSVDIRLVVDALRRMGTLERAGGVEVLGSIDLGTPSASHVDHYVEIVRRTATMRKLIDSAQKVAELGYRDNLDANVAIEQATRLVSSVNGARADEAPSATSESWPELDDAVYHGLAGDIVRAIAPHTEADPVSILVQTLLMFGNAVGRGPHFMVEGTRHGTNEAAVLVGDTSKSRKGTSEDRVRSLIRWADEGWTNTCIANGLSTGEGLIKRIRDPIEKTEAVKEKGKYTGEMQTFVSDAGVDDKRLLVVEAEFARVLRVAARDTNTLTAILRDAWDGRDLAVMTSSSPLRATEPHVSMIGHVTRDEIRRELSSTDAANGFANRFTWHAVRRAHELPFGGERLEGPLFNDLVVRLHQALEVARQISRVGMTPVARDIWVAVYSNLSAAKPGLLGAMIARGEAHVRRYALLYALLDGEHDVDEAHLLAALGVWEHAEASARWIFGDLLGDDVADTILGALRRRGELTRTDIRDLFQRHIKSDRIEAALRALEAASLASCEKRPSGGAPLEVWHAH